MSLRQILLFSLLLTACSSVQSAPPKAEPSIMEQDYFPEALAAVAEFFAICAMGSTNETLIASTGIASATIDSIKTFKALGIENKWLRGLNVASGGYFILLGLRKYLQADKLVVKNKHVGNKIAAKRKYLLIALAMSSLLSYCAAQSTNKVKDYQFAAQVLNLASSVIQSIARFRRYDLELSNLQTFQELEKYEQELG